MEHSCAALEPRESFQRVLKATLGDQISDLQKRSMLLSGFTMNKQIYVKYLLIALWTDCFGGPGFCIAITSEGSETDKPFV